MKDIEKNSAEDQSDEMFAMRFYAFRRVLICVILVAAGVGFIRSDAVDSSGLWLGSMAIFVAVIVAATIPFTLLKVRNTRKAMIRERTLVAYLESLVGHGHP